MGICNNTFIFKGVCQKGLWKKNKICFEIYSYPQKNLLLREYEELLGFIGVRSKTQDNIYLFIP